MINRKTVSLKRLTYQMVEKSVLESIHTNIDSRVEFSDSWEELILTLISMVYDFYTKDFMSKLIDRSVLSESIEITTSEISHPEIYNIHNEVYKLKDSPYYIELRKDGKNYIKAIKGLLIILNVDLKEVKFEIVSENKRKAPGERKAPNKAKKAKQTKQKDILLDAADKSIDNKQVTGISIMGAKQKVNSAQQALLVYIIWANSLYGEEVVSNAAIRNKTTEVGVTTAADIDNYGVNFKTEKIGDLYYYISENTNTILRYIISISLMIGVSPALIEIEYKKLEEG